jgi:hypothetical protein
LVVLLGLLVILRLLVVVVVGLLVGAGACLRVVCLRT